jgi:TolB protein
MRWQEAPATPSQQPDAAIESTAMRMRTTVRAIHPAWSHDGRRLLYCTNDDLRPPKKNASEIYSVDLATRRTTLLISGGVNTYPSLSPDGRRIAFRRMVGETNSEVFVANADGTDARNLTNNEAFDGWPEWSPDGTRLVFASNRGGTSYRIYVMDSDGSRVQLVANTVGRATAPHWSPDGSRIYFTNCVRVDADFQCNIFSGKVDSR